MISEKPLTPHNRPQERFKKKLRIKIVGNQDLYRNKKNLLF